MKRLIDRHTGMAPLALKQGSKEKARNVENIKKRNKIRDICLYCDEEDCSKCNPKKFNAKKKAKERNDVY
jgi:hypothetical protein